MARTFLFAAMCTTICFMSTVCHVSGQDKIRFQSTLYTGLLIGESAPGFQFQNINGIKYRGFWGGLGVGFDSYRLNSLPVFLSASQSLCSSCNSGWFVSGDLGLNWSIQRRAATVTGHSPDYYWMAGAGYRFPSSSGGSAFLLQLGYGMKYLRQHRNYGPACFPNGCRDNEESLRYNLSRLSLRFGWLFSR